MATITIKLHAPKCVDTRKVACICPHLEFDNSYIDTEAYAGTVYDTNIPGFGTWEGLVEYVANVTHSPNILIMFHKVVKEATLNDCGCLVNEEGVTFEESNPYVAEYINEVGTALAEYGFTVEVA